MTDEREAVREEIASAVEAAIAVLRRNKASHLEDGTAGRDRLFVALLDETARRARKSGYPCVRGTDDAVSQLSKATMQNASAPERPEKGVPPKHSDPVTAIKATASHWKREILKQNRPWRTPVTIRDTSYRCEFTWNHISRGSGELQFRWRVWRLEKPTGEPTLDAELTSPDDIDRIPWLRRKRPPADPPAGDGTETSPVLPRVLNESVLEKQAEGLLELCRSLPQRAPFTWPKKKRRGDCKLQVTWPKEPGARILRLQKTWVAVLLVAFVGVAAAFAVASLDRFHRLVSGVSFSATPLCESGVPSVLLSWSFASTDDRVRWGTQLLIQRDGKEFVVIDTDRAYEDGSVRPGERHTYVLRERDLTFDTTGGRLLAAWRGESNTVQIVTPECGTTTAASPVISEYAALPRIAYGRAVTFDYGPTPTKCDDLEWLWGDGTESTSAAPIGTHTYRIPGKYAINVSCIYNSRRFRGGVRTLSVAALTSDGATDLHVQKYLRNGANALFLPSR